MYANVQLFILLEVGLPLTWSMSSLLHMKKKTTRMPVMQFPRKDTAQQVPQGMI